MANIDIKSLKSKRICKKIGTTSSKKKEVIPIYNISICCLSAACATYFAGAAAGFSVMPNSFFTKAAMSVSCASSK